MTRVYEESTSILIIEDDPLIASCIKENLDEAGFVVVGTVSSGTEALSIAAETSISIALVDIRLTGFLDGIELVACYETSTAFQLFSFPA